MLSSNSVDAQDFLKLAGTILDVRSPDEFLQGHIPGAFNLPLFTNEERAQIGTLYKQQGKAQAIELGLKFAGPKLADFVAISRQRVTQTAKLHCWRGGMRSSSMAWLLETAGLQTVTLKRGYKGFRQWALSSTSVPKKIILLGGLTGSGKTAILQELHRKNEQVLDLEKLACHRGSSFGMMGFSKQPSNEQFENEIAVRWASFDSTLPIWIEDESRMIGSCKIPQSIFEQMRSATLFLIERPKSERIMQLKEDYGQIDPSQLIDSVGRIAKKLGGCRTKEVIQQIRSGNLIHAIDIVLDYYDKTYKDDLQRRSQYIYRLSEENHSNNQWAERILAKLGSICLKNSMIS